jgi:putative zinc finger protein
MTTRMPDSGRHPEELLAAYVDRSLADEALEAVERHLAECETCREDVRLAEAARERLRELPEVDVPAATRRAAAGALDREGSELGDAGRRDPRRWLAGLAAAAVIVGVIAVALPRLTSSDSAGTSAAARSEEVPSAAMPTPSGSGPPIVERQDIDYGPADVAALAADEAGATAAGAADEAGAPEQAQARQPPGAEQAIQCVRRWASAAQGAIPIRVIEATYQGRPAYLGVARQTPPGEASDRILVWVLARDACELISFTQRRT